MKSSKLLMATPLVAVLLLSCNSSSDSNYGSDNDPNLVAYWDFNDSGLVLSDLSGNRNHGVIYGASFVKGIDGRGLRFNGISDFVDLGKNIFGSSTGSITAWVKMEGSNTRNPILSQSDTSVGSNSFRVDVWEDSIALVNDHRACNSGTDFPTIKSLTLIDRTKWNFIAILSDGNRYNMFLNGVKVSYAENISTSGQWFNRLCPSVMVSYIGRWKRQQNDEFFFGVIDNIRVYNKVISEIQIVNEWNKYRNNI